MATCGRGYFLIREEIVADSKVSGYLWRGLEWAIEWLAIWSEPLLSGIQAYGKAPQRAYSSQVHWSIQSVQMILTLKRGQKGWRQLFSETLQRTVFANNEGSLFCFMCFILRHLVLLKLSREWALSNEKLYLAGMGLTLKNQYYMQSSQPKRPKEFLLLFLNSQSKMKWPKRRVFSLSLFVLDNFILRFFL